jgi:GNAT superfamily N-acetyltransferase
MIHVDPVHEGNGYGEMLLAEASAVLDHAGLPKMTLIKEGNTAMESLFQNAGWNIAEDKPIRHEGYQRRRWTQSKTCLR